MDLTGCTLAICAAVLLIWTVAAEAQETDPATGKPIIHDANDSPWGPDHFAQGGVVVDGIAYFLADHGFTPWIKAGDFPYGVAFRLRTLRKLRTYAFEDTYDSSPLVIRRLDGSQIIIAHEYQRERTVAMRRRTGEVAWVSPENQPGCYFFGYSYYMREDGSKLLLQAATNGLHALSAEDGTEVWWLQAETTGGVTPCVDQAAGVAYYQVNARVLKVDLRDGSVLAETRVGHPIHTISWNTVLVDDREEPLIATYWFGMSGGRGESGMQWNAGIRVFDADLNLIWERTRLPAPKKSTITYAEGKLVIGTGGHWAGPYEGEDWKYIIAYDVATGEESWRCDLRAVDFQLIMNVPYAYGSFYAEATGKSAYLLRIDAATGKLLDTVDYGAPVISCAPPIIARGLMLSGDLTRDGVVVTRIAEGSTADWPGPFGDPQTNSYALPAEPAARPVPMHEIKAGERTRPGA